MPKIPTTFVKVDSNGSRWLGELPATVSELLAVLGDHPLDRRFEDCGNFVVEGMERDENWLGRSPYRGRVGVVHFFGNFLTVSHVFSIFTDDPKVKASLTAAIHANRHRPDYLAQPKPTKFRTAPEVPR